MRDDAAQEPVVLAVAGHLGDHLAVEQPEVADVAGDLDRGQLVEHPVEAVGRRPLERGVLPAAPLREDDVDAVLPDARCSSRLTRGGSWRSVSMTIDGVRVEAGVQARGDGDLVTEVAGEAEHGDPVVGLAQLQQPVQRPVAAAVVDVDELEVEVGALEGGLDQRVVEHLEVGLLVVDRQHVGDPPSRLLLARLHGTETVLGRAEYPPAVGCAVPGRGLGGSAGGQVRRHPPRGPPATAGTAGGRGVARRRPDRLPDRLRLRPRVADRQP